jgi:DNA-binding transcriptional ArsR family regulator
MDKTALTLKRVHTFPDWWQPERLGFTFSHWKRPSKAETTERFGILDPETKVETIPATPPPAPKETENFTVAQTKTSPEGITQQLAKALAHPLRVRILSSLHKGVSSPNQLSQELGEPLGNVSYHVKTLLEYDCVELVKTEPRRGAVEHFYRATERAFFSASDWEKIPASARKGISGSILETVGHDATDALMAGSIDARTDSHVSRTPLILDDKGWTEITSLLADTLNRAIEIQEESAARLSKEKTDSISTKLAILHFESPEAKPSK